LQLLLAFEGGNEGIEVVDEDLLALLDFFAGSDL
jgi:hypothetical protein